MLHCARECNNRLTNPSSPAFITFGEFCLFATELRRYYTNHEKDPTTVFSQPMQVRMMMIKIFMMINGDFYDDGDDGVYDLIIMIMV